MLLLSDLNPTDHMRPLAAPRRRCTAILRASSPLPTLLYSTASGPPWSAAAISAMSWGQTAHVAKHGLAPLHSLVALHSSMIVAARRRAVYIMWLRGGNGETLRPQLTIARCCAPRQKQAVRLGGERQSSEWGVATTSTVVRPAKELLHPDFPDAPVATAAPIAAPALTVLIAVPTLEAGAADEGAGGLAHMLAANGHRAVVVSSGGRLEQ